MLSTQHLLTDTDNCHSLAVVWWRVHMYVCMYVCMYVHVCMRVCMYVWVWV